MASMLVEANLELKELAKFIDIPEKQYERAGLFIDSMAEEHTHMKTSEFVDLCLTLALINDN